MTGCCNRPPRMLLIPHVSPQAVINGFYSICSFLVGSTSLNVENTGTKTTSSTSNISFAAGYSP